MPETNDYNPFINYNPYNASNTYNPYRRLNPKSLSYIRNIPEYINRINNTKRQIEKRNAAIYKKTFKNKYKLPKFPIKSFLKSRNKRLKKRHPNKIFSSISSNGRVIKKTKKGKNIYILQSYHPENIKKKRGELFLQKLKKRKNNFRRQKRKNYEFKFNINSILSQSKALHNHLNPSGSLSASSRFKKPNNYIRELLKDTTV